MHQQGWMNMEKKGKFIGCRSKREWNQVECGAQNPQRQSISFSFWISFFFFYSLCYRFVPLEAAWLQLALTLFFRPDQIHNSLRKKWPSFFLAPELIYQKKGEAWRRTHTHEENNLFLSFFFLFYYSHKVDLFLPFPPLFQLVLAPPPSLVGALLFALPHNSRVHTHPSSPGKRIASCQKLQPWSRREIRATTSSAAAARTGTTATAAESKLDQLQPSLGLLL